MPMYEDAMRSVKGVFRRADLAYWQRWVLCECSMPKRALWIAEDPGAWVSLRGYMVAGVKGRKQGVTPLPSYFLSNLSPISPEQSA